MFSAALTGFDSWLADAERAIDAGADAGMAAASQLVADEAKASHPFQNRSGDLEGSIRALDVSGRASDDTLAGGVVAAEEYASYVDERLPFLAPAWSAREGDAARAMEAALDAALLGIR